MKSHYRDILKHAGVYGLGQVLSRLASVVLLPLYTHYLAPADYGVIAILDLTVGVFSILISGGMTAALSRYAFDAEGRDAEKAVWWTGLAVVTAMATVVLTPALLIRDWLARITLGPEEAAGGLFYALALGTLWCNMVGNVPNHLLRVRKWSWLFVGLMLGGLLLNIALNVYFLTVLHWGVAGVLIGNLLANAVLAAIRVAILARACGAPQFQWEMAGHLSRFGGPIVVTALLSLFMHYADRYILRVLVDLDQVGVYSLAYTIGQGLNALVLTPFSAIWAVVIYDIAGKPDSSRTFARMFEYFVYALLLFLLGVSLFIQPMLAWFAPASYAGAGRLVPVVCLSFVFFSLDEHFRVPALLAKRTLNLIPAYAIGATANIVLNVLFVPRFGSLAAAWASVATYAIFAGVGLLQCRKIERFDYPLARCGLVLGAMIVSFVGCQYVQALGAAWSLAAPAIVWIGWTIGLAYSTAWQQFRVPRLVDLTP